MAPSLALLCMAIQLQFSLEKPTSSSVVPGGEVRSDIACMPEINSVDPWRPMARNVNGRMTSCSCQVLKKYEVITEFEFRPENVSENWTGELESGKIVCIRKLKTLVLSRRGKPVPEFVEWGFRCELHLITESRAAIFGDQRVQLYDFLCTFHF